MDEEIIITTRTEEESIVPEPEDDDSPNENDISEEEWLPWEIEEVEAYHQQYRQPFKLLAGNDGPLHCMVKEFTFDFYIPSERECTHTFTIYEDDSESQDEDEDEDDGV